MTAAVSSITRGQSARIRTLVPILGYVFLGALAYSRWVPTNFNLPYFGNDTIYPLNAGASASWLFSMWDSAQFGQPSFYPALIPYFSILGTLHALGFDLGASQHIYEWLASFTGAVAVGKLAARISPFSHDHLTTVLAGAAYLFCPWAVFEPAGWWATVGTPLIALGLVRALDASSVGIAARWGLLGGLGSLLLLDDAPNFQLQIVVCVWCAVFIGTVLIVKRRRAAHIIARVGAYAAISVAVMLPLVAAEVWSVLPVVASGAASTPTKIGANMSYGDLGHTTLGSVLTLMSYYPLQWQNSAIRLLSMILPLLALLGALRFWRNSRVFAITVTTALCILITTGPNQPTAVPYIWFMTHVPGAVVFRSVGKVHLFIAMGYAALAPIALNDIAQRISRRIPSVAPYSARLIVSVAFLAVLLFVGWPVLVGQMFRTPVAAVDQPRIIPPIYVAAGNYLYRHSGLTLEYPESGYTQEPFENGIYFGPSLTTFAFSRNVVSSRGGGYGNPATSPIPHVLYAAIDSAIQSRPLSLFSGRFDSAVRMQDSHAQIYHHGAGYRIVTRNRSTQKYTVTVHVLARKPIALAGRILMLHLAGSGAREIRVLLDDVPLGTITHLSADGNAAFRIPANTTARQTVSLSIEFRAAVSNPVSLEATNLSILDLGIVDPLPHWLLDKMLRSGIQYIFFDGASNDPNNARFAAVIHDDPRLAVVMRDSDGRKLLRIDGHAYSAAALTRGHGLVPLGSPRYAAGRISLAFAANGATAAFVRQAYSSLWKYWVSVDGGRPLPVGARPAFGGTGILVPLPPGTRFVLTGVYLPQYLLVAQYVLFAAAACWAFLPVAICLLGTRPTREFSSAP